MHEHNHRDHGRHRCHCDHGDPHGVWAGGRNGGNLVGVERSRRRAERLAEQFAIDCNRAVTFVVAPV